MTNHDYPDPSRTIRQYLLQAMQTGEYSHGSRLPRESVLAEKLGISRTQLRDILASLEREGFIPRRHGVGTLINRYVFNVPTRMDIEVEFSDMIRQSGRQPRVDYVHVMEDTASEKIAAQLHLASGDPIVRVSRLVSADSIPVYSGMVFSRESSCSIKITSFSALSGERGNAEREILSFRGKCIF